MKKLAFAGLKANADVNESANANAMIDLESFMLLKFKIKCLLFLQVFSMSCPPCAKVGDVITILEKYIQENILKAFFALSGNVLQMMIPKAPAATNAQLNNRC